MLPFCRLVPQLLQRIARLDAHHRFLIALAVAALCCALLLHYPLWSVSLAIFDVFALVILTLLAITIMLTPAKNIRATARVQDVSRRLIFLFVILAACAGLFAVAFLIRNGKAQMQHHFTIHLLLSLVTVIFSWILVHAVFALRYAHNFYDDAQKPGEAQAGGLLFPEESEPDYRDFTYFSFVVGMTCQVSDVQVTGRAMRQLVLVHGVLSFAFNTAILALTINIVSSLL